jgi:hypothetical protein
MRVNSARDCYGIGKCGEAGRIVPGAEAAVVAGRPDSSCSGEAVRRVEPSRGVATSIAAAAALATRRPGCFHDRCGLSARELS